MSTNVKELRQLLAQKKEARVLKMLQLGEKVHKSNLLNKIENSEFKEDSAEILNLDKEIYTLSKTIFAQSQSQEKCTQCQSPIASNLKFCGQCGQLNAFYVDVNAPKKQCVGCKEQIDEQMDFCPCCGTAQGGI